MGKILTTGPPEKQSLSKKKKKKKTYENRNYCSKVMIEETLKKIVEL